MTMPLEEKEDKLPIGAIKSSIQRHIRPMKMKLPDKRLERVVEDMVIGIMGGEIPGKQTGGAGRVNHIPVLDEKTGMWFDNDFLPCNSQDRE